MADLPTAPISFEEKITRRKLIVNVGWGIFFAYVAGAAGAVARYMFPNVLYEPETRFNAGKPVEYPANTVSEKWLKEQRTWIINDGKGIYAMWARCTHLGCTPRWFSSEKRFRCPCHGSNYNVKGEVIAGPAPRPLFRCKISLDDQGEIVVDRSFGAIKSTLVDAVRENSPYYLKAS